MSNIYDIVIFEEFDKDGEKKSKSYQVGVAFDSKDGNSLNCVIAQGISISGRFSIFQRKEKAEAP